MNNFSISSLRACLPERYGRQGTMAMGTKQSEFSLKVLDCFTRTSFAMMFIFIFSLYNATAQPSIPPLERIVTISFQQERTDEVLKKLSQQAGFTFSYNATALHTQKLVSGKFTKKTIREVLEALFAGHLQYKQKSNYIILTKAQHTTDVVVRGYVVDEATGQKLKEVSVYDPVSLRSAITDEYGFFELEVNKPTAEEMKLAVKKRSYTDTLVMVSSKRSSFQNISLNIDEEKWQALADSIDNKLNRVWSWTKQSVQRINMRNIRDTIHRTWQISFVPFVGTNHKLSGNVVNDYSLNVLGGYSAGTRKAEFGGLFNINRGDVRHVQMAGLFNLNGGKVKGGQFAGLVNANFDSVKAAQFAGLINFNMRSSEGVQFAGLVNTNLHSVKAAQFAGLINFNRHSSEGVQFAGLLNSVIGSYEGSQVAGLFNFVLHDVNGAQVAGLFNVTPRTVGGAQVAGLFNISGGEVKGSQVAGILNVANKVRGTQVGFLNIADSVEGVPVGFLSFVNKGYHKIEIAADEIFPVNVALRTGVKIFHTILTAGIRPEVADTTTWSFGYGVGTAPKLSKNLFLNIDVTSNQVARGNIEALNLLNKLYLGLDYQIAKKFSIIAGATLNLHVYNADFINHAKLFTYYSPTIFSEGSFSNNSQYQMWWGGKVGIRFL